MYEITTQIFGINIIPMNTILLLFLFIVFLILIEGIGIIFYKKYVKKDSDILKGRYIGALICIIPLALIGFYSTAHISIESSDFTSEIPEIELVSSSGDTNTFTSYGLDVNTTIKNTGNKTMEGIHIELIGYDSTGNEVKTYRHTYFDPFLNISPGQSQNFTMIIDDPDHKVVRYKIIVKNYPFQ